MSSRIPLHAVLRKEGGVISYISFSRLSQWLTCPLAYQFRYIDGIKTPTSTGALMGKVIHGTLESFYRQRQAGVDWDIGQCCIELRRRWGRLSAELNVRFANLAEEIDLQRRALGLIAAYHLRFASSDPHRCAAEQPLQAPLHDPDTGEDLGIPLVGVLDLALETEAGPLIVDFKTSSRSPSTLEIAHELQMACYTYLFRHVAGRQEAGLEIRNLVYTKVPQIQVYPYPPRTDAHFRRLFAVIRAYLGDLRTGRFVYRPGWACCMCAYRDGDCRAWCS